MEKLKYFLDTEFIENGSTIDLISLGLACEDGRTLYMQAEWCDFTKASDWIWRNVCPHLDHFDFAKRGRGCEHPKANDFDHKGSRCIADRPGCPWRSRREFREEILKFCLPTSVSQPEFWGYYADYDWVVFCNLFGSMQDLPKRFPMYCRDIKQLCDDLGNPKLPIQVSAEHNALSDATWNFDSWKFLDRIRQNTVR